jgi:predicted dehydrogenase
MKSPVRAAVIGCGWIGLGAECDVVRIKPASHAQAYSLHGETELVALVDTDPAMLSVAERLYPSVKRFTDAKVMLAEVKPEIVSIATPPEDHCALIEMCARAGVKVILCEKPISENEEEAKKAIKIAQQEGVILLVNHMRRFDPLIRRYQEYIKGGYVHDTYIGPIKAVTAYMGTGLFHTGTHIVDLLRFFLGEAEWASAIRNDHFSCPKGDLNVDGFIGFKGGVVVALQSFEAKDYALSEVSFFGEQGRLTLRGMAGMRMELRGIRTCPEYAYKELNEDQAILEGTSRSWIQSAIAHAVECFRGTATPMSTGEDALAALKILRALQKSSEEEGKIVRLK